MNYRESRIQTEGRCDALDGKSIDTNPYRPKTNFHRYYVAGFKSVRPAMVPVHHTYKIGDKVWWRKPWERERMAKKGQCTFFVDDIIPVPLGQIEFNPNIHEDFNETGVGHHQWLVLRGHEGHASGYGVDLVPERVEMEVGKRYHHFWEDGTEIRYLVERINDRDYEVLFDTGCRRKISFGSENNYCALPMDA